MLHFKCPYCEYRGVANTNRTIDIRCPSCNMIFCLSHEGDVLKKVRQVQLVGAKSYKMGRRRFVAGQPVEIYDDNTFNRILGTNLFMTVPSIETMVVRYRGPRLFLSVNTPSNKRFILPKDQYVRIDKATLSLLTAKDGTNLEVVSNQQLLEHLKTLQYFKAFFVRDMGLGDVLIFNSCLNDFKRQHPQAYVVAGTRADYMFLLRDVADEVVDYRHPIDAFQFDITANLCRKSEIHELNATMHRAEIYAHFMGFQLQEQNFKYNVRPEILEETRQLLNGYGCDPAQHYIIGIQPIGSTPIRSLDLPAMVNISELLLAKNSVKPIKVLFLHDRYIKTLDRKRSINLTGKLSSHEHFCGIIYWCNLVISPDSAAYHVKEAVGNGKAIAVFSSINPDLRVRYYKNVIPLWQGYEPEGLTCGQVCVDRGCNVTHCLRYWNDKRMLDKIIPLLKEEGVLN